MAGSDHFDWAQAPPKSRRRPDAACSLMSLIWGNIPTALSGLRLVAASVMGRSRIRDWMDPSRLQFDPRVLDHLAPARNLLPDESIEFFRSGADRLVAHGDEALPHVRGLENLREALMQFLDDCVRCFRGRDYPVPADGRKPG